MGPGPSNPQSPPVAHVLGAPRLYYDHRAPDYDRSTVLWAVAHVLGAPRLYWDHRAPDHYRSTFLWRVAHVLGAPVAGCCGVSRMGSRLPSVLIPTRVEIRRTCIRALGQSVRNSLLTLDDHTPPRFFYVKFIFENTFLHCERRRPRDEAELLEL